MLGLADIDLDLRHGDWAVIWCGVVDDLLDFLGDDRSEVELVVVKELGGFAAARGDAEREEEEDEDDDCSNEDSDHYP